MLYLNIVDPVGPELPSSLLSFYRYTGRIRNTLYSSYVMYSRCVDANAWPSDQAAFRVVLHDNVRFRLHRPHLYLIVLVSRYTAKNLCKVIFNQ